MEKKKIFVVGSGKLANAIVNSSLLTSVYDITKWEASFGTSNEKSIIIHAGSGRELNECLAFCSRTNSVFVELSTGLPTESMSTDFTLIVCPNTSILLLKTLNVVKMLGDSFTTISITESHQSSKKSAPGTAYSFAESLNFPITAIKSIREREIQVKELGIPAEYLDKHAYHRIVIGDGLDRVTIETKVLGHESYTNGVSRIIKAILGHRLERRRYSIIELIQKGVI